MSGPTPPPYQPPDQPPDQPPPYQPSPGQPDVVRPPPPYPPPTRPPSPAQAPRPQAPPPYQPGGTGEPSHPAGPATGWYLLGTGEVLWVQADPETGAPEAVLHRTTRPVGADDLLRYEQQLQARFSGPTGRPRVLLVSGVISLLGFLAAAVGVVLYQVDATEQLGSSLFWIGLPLAIVARIVFVVARGGLERHVGRLRLEAGLVPDGLEELDPARAGALVAAPGTVFVPSRV